MPLRRAKSPQEIYDEVADHDLVLVPDAPLASAINRRIDKPHFGVFAITPRRLAAGRREQAEDRIAFLEVIDETDHAWKNIVYHIGNIIQCREHRGSIDAILDYDAYVDTATRDAIEIMRRLRTTSQQLTDHTIPGEMSVAVVGEPQFTTLERSVLPETYDRIPLFTDDEFDRPPFHVFDSETAIVDALLETITAEGADPENVAVVLDGASEYSSLVESALEAADVPFYGGPGFTDDAHHRAFVQLLRAAFRGSATTVGDVRPILTAMGVPVERDHDEKRFAVVEAPAVEWLQTFVDAVDEHTFDTALDAYERRTDVTLSRFREELAALGLADAPVTADQVDDLAYYLQSYEVPVDRENEGVLLADAKASGYVDRPVVFYLGLDEGWTHSAPQRPWVDTEAQFERHIQGFQLLLQSGAEQYYLVQDTAGGQPVTPCLYFDELLAESFERFTDLDSVRHRAAPRESGDGFEHDPVGVDSGSVDLLSQSSLNSYVNCPRDYFFGELVDIPDQERFVEGNLFHDFAEFYVNHPDIVHDAGLERIVDLMLDEAAPFVTETAAPLTRRKYRIGLETIVDYLDAHGPTSEAFLTATSGWGTNFFAQHFDEELDSPLTERWFENDTLGLKGKIDLVQSPTELLDYKSGRKKSATQVVNGAATDPPADTPNFQALLYLSHYRTVRPNERLSFTFFHFLETLDDVVAGDAALEDTLTTVTYYPSTFDAYVGSRDAFETLLDGYNDCVATFEDLGYDAYSDIVGQLSFPETTDKAELRASEFATAFTAAVDAATSDDVDAEKGCDQAIRALNGVRKGAFFREDLDAFEAFVEDQRSTLNDRRTGGERFPIEGPSGEPNYRRVDHRDLLLEGGGERRE